MSQRTDQRTPTKINLLAYDKVLKLSAHVMSVCKPKDKNVNTCHIPKRNVGLGRQLMEVAVECGADILEANYGYYVGGNLNPVKRLENYKKRVELQEHAKSLTFRMEHIFRILYYDRPFAESTTSYMMDLLTETRDAISAWRESEIKEIKKLEKQLSL